jgi:hypothetical protein
VLDGDAYRVTIPTPAGKEINDMASRLTPTLLALSLAAAFAIAPAPVLAQSVQTSQGLRTLPRTDGFRSQAQYAQALRIGEDIAEQLLADIATIEQAQGAVTQQVGSLAEDVKRANREYELAKATFDQLNQKYLADLAAFQQSQVALEAEIQRQRAQAAQLEALPSAQRDYAEVTRMNDWATQLAAKRSAIDAENTRLLADHENVEAERAKLAQKRKEAEARLGGRRDEAVSNLGSSSSRRAAAYGDLRVTINYLRQVRADMVRLAGGAVVPHSLTLDRAQQKLGRYEAER